MIDGIERMLVTITWAYDKIGNIIRKYSWYKLWIPGVVTGEVDLNF
jgi:hypothetical protein